MSSLSNIEVREVEVNFWSDSSNQVSQAREVQPANAGIVLLALLIGLAFDLAVRRQPSSVSVALLVVVVAAGLLASGRLVTRHSRVLVALAPLFSSWVILRSSPWLIPLDLLAAAGLIAVGVATSNHRSLQSLGLQDVIREPLDWVQDVLGSLSFLTRGIPAGSSGRLRAVAAGLAMTLPIVGVLGALLASGDALSGAVVNTLGASGLAGHAAMIVLGAFLGLVILFRAAVADRGQQPAVPRLLGHTEAMVIIGGITLLYTAFVGLQLAGALGATSHILDDPAETSEWARRGFFQLLWAAGITLSILLTLEHVRMQNTTGRYRFVASATAVLTIVIVGISVSRTLAYSDTFGLTMLRLYSTVFALWVGAVFVLFLLRLWNNRGRQWFSTASAALGLALLLGLNVANPEARVANYDTASVERFDVHYLTDGLSMDAIPSLVARLEDLSQPHRRALEDALCRLELPQRAGWLSWNRSRSQARTALLDLCGSGEFG